MFSILPTASGFFACRIRSSCELEVSLEELRLDYQDFLRQRGLPLWAREDARRAELITRRPATADDVAGWARDMRERDGQDEQRGLGAASL